MRIDDFDYTLPESLIAQYPADRRDQSRLLVLDRAAGTLAHRRFSDLPEYLRAGDCLVLNESKVLPARLFGQKTGTGAQIEILLSRRKEGDIWEILAKPAKRLKAGDRVSISVGRLEFTVLGEGTEGTRLVRFEHAGDFQAQLEALGAIPLPPYIRRGEAPIDRERYQTVYSHHAGSVAAPTAGLHFTEDLLQKISRRGVGLARISLHVGMGTFRPVQTENIEDHRMHFEEYQIDPAAADLINQTRAGGGRIIAVGTTSARTLESAATASGQVLAGAGDTGIFIYPGYTFRATDCLITNFHLPKSTLLLLVSALYNREAILHAYQVAIAEQYRFFSYGDAMLIL